MFTVRNPKPSFGFFLQAGAHKELRNAKKPQLHSKHSTKHTYASRLSQRGPLPTCRVPSKARPLATDSHPFYGVPGGLTTSSKAALSQRGYGDQPRASHGGQPVGQPRATAKSSRLSGGSQNGSHKVATATDLDNTVQWSHHAIWWVSGIIAKSLSSQGVVAEQFFFFWTDASLLHQ